MSILAKWTLVVVLAILLCSCEKNLVPEINENPSSPVPKTPDNYSQLQSKSVLFSWDTSKDPEGEEVVYNLQVSENADFTRIIFSDALTTIAQEIEVPEPGFYYWRIRAKDGHNNTSAFSSRQNFSVADAHIDNYAPFPPERCFPEIDAEVNSEKVELGWKAVDLDDTHLRYDIYIGKDYGHQTLLARQVTDEHLTISLEPETVYYWKVKVSDPHGQTEESPVWWFKSL